jgi:phosphotriesterase-related protein
MKQIMTVLGPITPENLGLTSMHEHVLYDGSLFRKRYEKQTPSEVRSAFESGLAPDLRDNWNAPIRLEIYGALLANYALSRDNLVNDDEEMMAGELSDFKAAGGSALLDVSSIGLRSNIPGLKRLSERSGIHIIASTGFYTEDFWPEQFSGFSADQFRAQMVSEIEEGIPGSGVKAGHIKLAITDLSAAQERALRGGARAAIETGAAISIHPGIGIGSDGRRIAKILMDEGLKPERIVIAHADGFMVEHDLHKLVMDLQSWGLNLDYHHALLDQGVNISIDCFGHRWYLELSDSMIEHDWQRLAGLVALIKEGYSSQIVLGTDTFLKILTRRGGGEGYCHLTRFVLPELRRFEVSDYDIRQMMIETPARLLSI